MEDFFGVESNVGEGFGHGSLPGAPGSGRIRLDASGAVPGVRTPSRFSPGLYVYCWVRQLLFTQPPVCAVGAVGAGEGALKDAKTDSGEVIVILGLRVALSGRSMAVQPSRDKAEKWCRVMRDALRSMHLTPGTCRQCASAHGVSPRAKALRASSAARCSGQPRPCSRGWGVQC